MNSQQLKYAKERLEQLYRQKSDALGSVYSWGLTQEEKIRAFHDGDYGVELKNNGFVVVFSGDEEKKEFKRKESVKLKEEYNRIMDELVLGDQEQALALINQFKEST